MPTKRINSTGRKRILHQDVRITVRTDSNGASIFGADLSLHEYEMPGDSLVFVEAYRQATFMRFPYGTVNRLAPPADPGRRLTEFQTPDAVLFRVKVTSSAEPLGVLLAEGDQIRPVNGDEKPDERVPILPPCPRDLGQEAWRVEITDDGALLLVNNRLGDWKAVASAPLFRSLVYPAAMRQILWRIYKTEGATEIDDHTDWRCRWLKFAEGLPGSAPHPVGSEDDSQWEDWISDAVRSFAQQHKMLDHLSTEFGGIRGEPA
jgi:hypothetical protein